MNFKAVSARRAIGRILVILVSFVTLALALPLLLVARSEVTPEGNVVQGSITGNVDGSQSTGGQGVNSPIGSDIADTTPIRVYLSQTGEVETVTLEQYVTGVLAAEMPAEFDVEALKAQAIAARTFIVERLTNDRTDGLPDGITADVTDTVAHQAYLSRRGLERWITDGAGEQLAKLTQAVQNTRDLIMTYGGKPITASFFSASNGYTENSEDYFANSVPYLRSVASPWDAEIDPQYKQTVYFTVTELFNKLGISKPVMSTLGGKSSTWQSGLFKVLSTTQGKRIKEIKIADTLFTGREVREKLELRSSYFQIRMGDNGEVQITTYGYGHGVGMSQWGANGMAKAGYTTTQILKHYYTGIQFQKASRLLKR